MYYWVAAGFLVYQYDRKEMSSFWLLCYYKKYFNSFEYFQQAVKIMNFWHVFKDAI